MVLLQVSPGTEPLVYDLDSDLLFPCSLRQYGVEALRSDLHIKPNYHRSHTPTLTHTLAHTMGVESAS